MVFSTWDYISVGATLRVLLRAVRITITLTKDKLCPHTDRLSYTTYDCSILRFSQSHVYSWPALFLQVMRSINIAFASLSSLQHSCQLIFPLIISAYF